MRQIFFNLVSCFVFLKGSPPVSALPAEARTVAVQFFQWRWKDIARECQTYLGPLGVAAVLVPPPHDHIDLKNTPWRAPWWERYQVISYELASRSGSKKEFTEMIQECTRAGVDIYVDAVINHMAGFSEGVGFSGATFTQYNYPGLFSYWDFNHCGVTPDNQIHDFYDKYQLQFFELLGLADLATHRGVVRRKIRDYLESLTDLGVKGFRIDAAKHIPSQDILAITRGLRGDPYIFQELIGGNGGPILMKSICPTEM
jgi:alpha-amylase